ncbi:MAG: DUF4317 domain-containing protein [Ruminococcus bicirculans]|uniref:DUF4317 domain-containing protein n=1 Tax=Ruminococcus bicirculans (ex Wegman et al. 2014) TaxID=1160721 RepID=UPI00242DB472|nr:DUF4317 domain-containing protein [Ruminococcus bicirculans (ex Wegman et al. 2014)]MBS6818853.1 DUF4317 domain-containing protein [Ruminococcus bicirculans (ex Wegman et al. 2014)]
MNKKEINEIKKNFSDDCGFFTVNHVVTAFVDAEKNIKCKTNQLYNTIPQDEAELIMINLKKVLSGSIGKNLLEYSFPKDAYLEGGAQPFMYETLQSKLLDEEKVDNFLNAIVEKVEYVSTYTIFMAHCTYSVLKKNKMDEFEDEADTDYNFIVTALCPVNLRIDGLVYDEQDNSIAKKESCDRIVELPSDGFLFPLFNDRAPDINGVLYYTKNAKKPNTSVVEELLGCELFVDQNAHETEIPTIDEHKLSSILWEAGVSQDKLDNLPKVFDAAAGGKPLTAVNLVEKRTVVSAPSITVNIGKDAVDKVKTQIVDGRKCLIINLDDPEIEVNGLETTIK